MKQFIIPALVMLGILIIFFTFGGLPRPADIQWQNKTWSYAGRVKGIITYKSQSGSEFTIDHLPGKSFILGIDGQEYEISIAGQGVTIRFPDGRETRGNIVVFLEGVM